MSTFRSTAHDGASKDTSPLTSTNALIAPEQDCCSLDILLGRYRGKSIGVLDYGNYPYIRSTCAALRRLGLDVRYVFSSAIQSPHFSSSLCGSSDDDKEIGIGVAGEFKKYSFFQRWRQEREWAKNCIAYLSGRPPEILLSANTPLEVQKEVAKWCRQNRVRFVFWLQDIHGIAIRKLLSRKWPIVGQAIGFYYQQLEKRMLRTSDHVILISDDHVHLMARYGVEPSRISVLPNWALVEDFPRLEKVNRWSESHGLENTFNFIYSGTLGMKHSPDLLLELAKEFRQESKVRVVVISEGLGAEWLSRQKQEQHIENLTVLPFQPYAELPLALASSDVLLTLLDSGASEFSVPSKVLTYLCSGRPQLMSLCPANLAGRLVGTLEAGLVFPQHDRANFLRAAWCLYRDQATRHKMSERAREYAECEFQIELVAVRFLQVLDRTFSMPSARNQPVGIRRASQLPHRA